MIFNPLFIDSETKQINPVGFGKTNGSYLFRDIINVVQNSSSQRIFNSSSVLTNILSDVKGMSKTSKDANTKLDDELSFLLQELNLSGNFNTESTESKKVSDETTVIISPEKISKVLTKALGKLERYFNLNVSLSAKENTEAAQNTNLSKLVTHIEQQLKEGTPATIQIMQGEGDQSFTLSIEKTEPSIVALASPELKKNAYSIKITQTTQDDAVKYNIDNEFPNYKEVVSNNEKELIRKYFDNSSLQTETKNPKSSESNIKISTNESDKINSLTDTLSKIGKINGGDKNQSTGENVNKSKIITSPNKPSLNISEIVTDDDFEQMTDTVYKSFKATINKSSQSNFGVDNTTSKNQKTASAKSELITRSVQTSNDIKVNSDNQVKVEPSTQNKLDPNTFKTSPDSVIDSSKTNPNIFRINAERIQKLHEKSNVNKEVSLNKTQKLSSDLLSKAIPREEKSKIITNQSNTKESSTNEQVAKSATREVKPLFQKLRKTFAEEDNRIQSTQDKSSKTNQTASTTENEINLVAKQSTDKQSVKTNQKNEIIIELTAKQSKGVDEMNENMRKDFFEDIQKLTEVKRNSYDNLLNKLFKSTNDSESVLDQLRKSKASNAYTSAKPSDPLKILDDAVKTNYEQNNTKQLSSTIDQAFKHSGGHNFENSGQQTKEQPKIDPKVSNEPADAKENDAKHADAKESITTEKVNTSDHKSADKVQPVQRENVNVKPDQTVQFHTVPKEIQQAAPTVFAQNSVKVNVNEQFQHELNNKLVNEISDLAISDKKDKVVINLEPASLGKIKIAIEIIENKVNARLEVEHHAAKEMLQHQVEFLKESLSSNGLQLNSLNISLQNSDQKHAKTERERRKESGSNEKVETKEKLKNESSTKTLGYNTYEFIA